MDNKKMHAKTARILDAFNTVNIVRPVKSPGHRKTLNANRVRNSIKLNMSKNTSELVLQEFSPDDVTRLRPTLGH